MTCSTHTLNRQRGASWWSAWVVLIVVASGCAATKKEPVTPPAPESKPQITLPALAAACEALKTKGIPVECATRYSEGTLLMIAHFEQAQALQQYQSPMDQYIAQPFCKVALRDRQTARFLLELHGQGYRFLVCETGLWSDWVAVQPTPTAKQDRPSRPLNPEEACRVVENDRNVPIHCKIMRANGMTTMLIVFLENADVDQYVKPMLTNVGETFCAESNRQGSGALVQIQLRAKNLGAVYNCETEKISPWMPLQQKSETGRAAPPTPAPQAPPRQPPGVTSL
jgi:hypothetical protein